MAYIGDVSICFPVTAPSFFLGQFTRVKQPTSVVVDIPGVNPGSPVYLFTSPGTAVSRINASNSGHAFFYDLDDGGYAANEVGSGNSWSVTVVGAVVTVVRLSSAGDAISVYAA